MNDLASIATPRAVAVWLSTDPDKAATSHAFDQLVEARGHDVAMRVWITGMRIASATNGTR